MIARKGSAFWPVYITFSTMLYAPGKTVRLHTYAELVTWLMQATASGKAPLVITSVRQIP